MKILICNDDGIHAPGIMALYEAVRDLGEVSVVAPLSEQSAVGHAITISNPIKVQKVFKNGEFFGHGVGGTPADAVKLALASLLDGRPDLIISGINYGTNAGIAVIYSGTVSAATEGTVLGVPSIAVSLASFKDAIWDSPKRAVREAATRVMKNGLPPETLLNINVPNLPWEKIRGYRVTTMCHSRYEEIFHRRTDPRGNVYFWMDGDIEKVGDATGTDLQALDDGFISITPIWFDLTHREALDRVRRDWAV